ncbi:MAG: hypothetical protein WD810_07495 [Solirubrobacterales bacterium]
MSVPRRLIIVACALALITSSTAVAGASAASSGGDGATSSTKKKKKCPKGYKLKTVTRHGKKVKKCRKVKGKGGGTGAPGGQTGLFEAPGRKLEGNEAIPFLQRYLANSTFTDCPAGWPNCAVEQRYSHTSGGSFYYCRLTSVSGADIINGARSYQVQNAVVEADGSWTFNELVESGGRAFYEWHVATNGVVNGAYQFESNAIEQIGPLQYVPGARDCSY